MTRASALERAANTAPAHRAHELRNRAREALERAEPIAADAAAADSNWQALSANLAEIPTVSPSLVLPALRKDCTQVGKI